MAVGPLLGSALGSEERLILGSSDGTSECRSVRPLLRTLLGSEEGLPLGS